MTNPITRLRGIVPKPDKPVSLDDMNRASALRKYVASRPKDVKLSDKDILAEVSAVRYGIR